ncbi:TRAP transporter substrate-binding protein [Paracoccus sediminicola]|uniref:TRAP transporter substrate-binding protein n=1 Tax=Paracoccus sediminicola TaxID=3017783 RepID=UPI0022EFF15A|nr:TRAP transporter substrate-binding protein [Paracoccus sediminicola]WBU56662.1 TRAP transporter substrate-binding protein [Paracoccus sediminicola]
MKHLLISTVALCALSAPAFAQEVTLRVHHFLSADAPIQAGVLNQWEKTVEEQSGDRIDVQIYPSMQLGGKPPQLFDQARDGVVDIVWTVLGYTPGRFPKAEVFELPFIAGTALETTMALQQYQEKYLADELEEVHPLLIHAPAAYKIHIKGDPVQELADLGGLKVRTPSRVMTDLLQTLGATPVGMPVPELPQALSTGVIDSAVLPWEVSGSLRLEEIAKEHTEFGQENGGMATSVFALVMNKAKYDGLPEDLKQVIDDNSGAALAPLAGKAFDAAEAEERQQAIDAGGTVHVIPEDQVAEWAEAGQPAIDAWVESMTEAGLDGQAMLDDARAMMEEARAE